MMSRAACTFAALLAILAMVMPLWGQSDRTDVVVQILAGEGATIYNPQIGRIPYDRAIQGVVIPPAASLQFTFAVAAPPTAIAGVDLVFELRTRRAQWHPDLGADDPYVVGRAVFPLDTPTPPSGAHQFSFAQLYGGAPDPDQTYFLGAYVSGARTASTSVDFYINNRQVGIAAFPFFEILGPFSNHQVHYRVASVAPPAQIQAAGDSPHALSPAAVGQIGGRDVMGVISGYAYAFEDTRVSPDIFHRIWQLYRVDGSGNATRIWSQAGNDHRIQFAAPAYDSNPSVHYRLFCQTFDGYGLPGQPFDLDPTRTDVFLLEGGEDMTQNHCLRAGWQKLRIDPAAGLIEAACDPAGFDAGQVYAAPLITPSTEVQATDRFQIRLTTANGAVNYSNCGGAPCLSYPPNNQNGPFGANPTQWQRWSVTQSDFPVQLQWRWQNRYGVTDYSPPVSIPFLPYQAPSPGFAPQVTLNWDTRPSQVYPGMAFAARIDANQGDGLLPYYALWLYNVDDSGKHVPVGQDSEPNVCLLATSALVERLRLPDDLSPLDLQPGQGVALRAKVLWSALSPCGANPYLTDFNAAAASGQVAAAVDSATVTGQSGQTFQINSWVALNDKTVNPNNGSVGFYFEEQHSAPTPPDALWWRWVDAPTGRLWKQGQWVASSQGVHPWIRVGDGQIEGTSDVDAFSSRWRWDGSNLITPGGSAPFAPDGGKNLVQNFFGAIGEARVQFQIKMCAANVCVEYQPTAPIVIRPAAIDLNIADVRMYQVGGAATTETEHLHTYASGVTNIPFQIDFTSPSSQPVNLAVLKQDPVTLAYAPIVCDTLANFEATGFLANLTLGLAAPPSNQNPPPDLNARISVSAGQGLLDLLNGVTAGGGAGRYKLRFSTDDCVSGNLVSGWNKDITVNPAQAFSLTLHFSDHLGSVVMTQTYSPRWEGSVSGTPLRYVIAGTPVWLYPHPVEHTVHAPFGEQLTAVAAAARYTDHEYDAGAALNYMKGRYQDPGYGKFTRPDPARDWDWENPASLNLYQYVRNNPINLMDLLGKRVNVKSFGLLRYILEGLQMSSTFRAIFLLANGQIPTNKYGVDYINIDLKSSRNASGPGFRARTEPDLNSFLFAESGDIIGVNAETSIQRRGSLEGLIGLIAHELSHVVEWVIRDMQPGDFKNSGFGKVFEGKVETNFALAIEKAVHADLDVKNDDLSMEDLRAMVKDVFSNAKFESEYDKKRFHKELNKMLSKMEKEKSKKE